MLLHYKALYKCPSYLLTYLVIVIIIMKTYKAPLTGAQRRRTAHACTETKTNSNMLKTDKRLHETKKVCLELLAEGVAR